MTDRPDADNITPDGPDIDPGAAGTAGPVTDIPAPEPAGPSAGQLLRDGRAARDMSVAQLATETRIKPAILDLLEADRDPEDQAPVFVRGYYRRCARVLGLSEDEVLRAYERRAGSLKPSITEPTEWVSVVRKPARVPFPGGAWALLAAVAVFVIVIVGLALLRDGNRAASATRLTSQVANAASSSAGKRVAEHHGLHQATAVHTDIKADVTASRSETSKAPPETPTVQPEAPRTAALPAAVSAPAQPVAAAEPPAQQQAQQPAAAATAEQGPVLRLHATDNCWVSIKDAAGKRLLQGIVGEGQSRQVQGQPPYYLVLGNAHAISLTYAGKAVDISGQINPGSNTARFNIPLQQ